MQFIYRKKRIIYMDWSVKTLHGKLHPKLLQPGEIHTTTHSPATHCFSAKFSRVANWCVSKCWNINCSQSYSLNLLDIWKVLRYIYQTVSSKISMQLIQSLVLLTVSQLTLLFIKVHCSPGFWLEKAALCTSHPQGAYGHHRRPIQDPWE